MTTIRKEFTVHMLNQEGKDKAALIAEGFSRCLNLLEDVCGSDGREMSIVRTKLEEASYYAKRSMAQRPENQMSGPPPEPYEQNRDFVRDVLRFRDDGREWGGAILLETDDGQTVNAVAEGLGGTVLVRLPGADRLLEFDRFSGACVDGAKFGKLRIAAQELYRVHPETYRIRQAKAAAQSPVSP
jgi:hypothetical protein